MDSYEVGAVHNDEMIKAINAMNSTWTAGVSKRFQGHTMDHVRSLCGSLEGGIELPVKEFSDDLMSLLSIPKSFDSRDKWGSICPSLYEIRDQGSCGSCWAVAAAEAISDRTCIGTKGKFTKSLSSEDLLSCCGDDCGSGCDGGYPEAAWSYWTETGIVTGGAYNSNEGCLPYEIASCDHHVVGKEKPCGASESTPTCPFACKNDLSWASDKHLGRKSYQVSSDPSEIQAEIMLHGPVEAAFTVYTDFPSYKSGVYQHLTGEEEGGHAVKIVGWGEEDGTPYWLVANSWNTDWGLEGYFKILRGRDECGIESSIVAGIV